MPRDNPYRPFTPRPEQLALKPDITGNWINGLGESRKRRARTVYWAKDPDTIAHGKMQRWFYQAGPESAEINAAREERAAMTAFEPDPVTGFPVERSEGDWLDALRAYVQTIECERIGVTRLDKAWLYEGVERDYTTVIVLAVQHDYDRIAHAPEPPAGAEVVRQYGRAAASAKHIAGWLQRQGWQAEAVTGPMAGPLLLIPPAIACGFGELGKHGSLIDAEFGSSFRLSAVMTSAPIAETPPQVLGVDDFCASCRVCENACPPEAIAPHKQTVRGEEKWYVNFDRCLPFFNQTSGCAICIAVCPWSRPGVGLNLAAKLKRRRENAEIDQKTG